MNIIEFIHTKDEQIWVDLDCFDILPNKYEISNFGNFRRKYDKYPLNSYIQVNKFGAYATIALQTIHSGRKTKRFLVHRLVNYVFNQIKDYNYMQVNHIDNNGLNNYYENLEWVTSIENVAHCYKCLFTNLEIYNVYELIIQGFSDDDIVYILHLNDNIYTYYMIMDTRLSVYNNTNDDYNIDNILYNSSNFTKEQVIIICEMLQQNKTYLEMADKLNIDLSDYKHKKSFNACISNIRTRKSYYHISKDYNW